MPLVAPVTMIALSRNNMPASFTHPALPRGHCHGWSTAQPGRGASEPQKFQRETTETCRQAFCLAEAWTQLNAASCLPKTSIQRARSRWLPACPKRRCAALMGAGIRDHVGHDEAVRHRTRGAAVKRAGRVRTAGPAARDSSRSSRKRHRPIGSKRVFALSSTVHASRRWRRALFMAAFNLAPRAASLKLDEQPAEPMRLVFLATPGPGGGGGGGGLLQKAPPPKALREGHAAAQQSAARPPRAEADRAGAGAAGAEPPAPPLKAEHAAGGRRADHHRAGRHAQSRRRVLKRRPRRTTATAPAKAAAPGPAPAPASARATAAASDRDRAAAPAADRIGPAAASSRRVCCAKCRPTTPRTRGSAASPATSCSKSSCAATAAVGDVKILQGLAGGLNDRAVQAVRQWRFAPARRQGAPVDVIVEVAVEFKLR